MRLFFALRLSPSVAEALAQAQADLRRQGRGTFPPPENLHLTLAFLGRTEDLAGGGGRPGRHPGPALLPVRGRAPGAF